jgi:hypothetical protein
LRDGDWQQATFRSEHAGLFLLVPELVRLEIPELVAAGGYPGTRQLSALNSLLALLALKLYERRRRSHVEDVVHDPALGLFCGLTVLPKRSHPTGSATAPRVSTTASCSPRSSHASKPAG